MSANVNQNFLYETDSLDNFVKVLDTMVKVMYEEQPSEYSQLFLTKRSNAFNNGKRFIDPKDKSFLTEGSWSKPKYFHICSIGDYRSEITEKDEVFDNYDNLIKKVMLNVKNVDTNLFLKQCGDGLDSFFDGSIGIGYRINQRFLGAWEHLDISLCHIFYGK